MLGGCVLCIYTNGVCAGCQYDLGEDFPIKAYHAAMKIDLHCHSTASDGSLTPRELVQRAHNLHVNILALTDHDTLAGIEPALHALGEIKGGTPLRLVNGIEISCRWQSFEIHILGWHFNREDTGLKALVSRQSQARRERTARIMEKLTHHGVAAEHLAAVQAKQALPDELVTRKHIAEALVAEGYVKTMDDAFKRYIGKGQCAYTTPQWCTIDEAVQAVKAAGGVTAVAHPLAYDMSTKWLKRLLTDFVAAGGDALEVSSGQQTPQQRQTLAQLASQFALTASAGSDFHNPGRWRELGHNIALPAECQPVWHEWPEVQALKVS